MNEKEQKIFDQFPKPPADATFSLVAVRTISMPHPYCITPKHVTVASDDFSGILGIEAIRGAENKGARCGVKGCNLSYDEHENMLTLLIGVPRDVSGVLGPKLNDIPGLHAYLLSIKEQAEGLGITGFAFPPK